MSQRFLSVSYRMYTHSPASHKLLFETPENQPANFVTEMGLMIDAFEQRLSALSPGDDFDFVLEAKDAFGLRDEILVRPLPRKKFEINGRFVEEEIFPGAEVPLMDSEGNHFQGTIVKVTDTEVIVDLNNPLAGRDLQFTGRVLENREPTLQEIEYTAKILAGECGGCGGDCGSCGGCGESGGCGK